MVRKCRRFGLAQLHQLRGRVGRGATASHCILLYDSPLSKMAEQRIAVMRDSSDGFVIAEGLELRGPGEVLGTTNRWPVSVSRISIVTSTICNR